jgi:hypothetical protein
MYSGRRISRVLLTVLVVALGLSRPALAQIDFTGEWRPLFHEDVGHRIDDPNAGGPGTPAGAGGPRIGDYTGLPINDAGRLKADSWDPRINEATEHQTIIHPGAYWIWGAGGMRFRNIIDEDTQAVVAIEIFRAAPPGANTRIIWMDGRPAPPSFAAHTWWGFSTGEWNGGVLTVRTTHMKAGWIRRNGVPASDQATMIEYFARHGSYLTLTRILDDPVYLEEPLITTLTWILDPNQQLVARRPDIVSFPDQPDVFVPHYLFGANPFLHELADKYGIPFDATRGGSETTYPEYARKLAARSKTGTR